MIVRFGPICQKSEQNRFGVVFWIRNPYQTGFVRIKDVFVPFVLKYIVFQNTKPVPHRFGIIFFEYETGSKRWDQTERSKSEPF